MSLALISLGSNLGDRGSTLSAAAMHLRRSPGIVMQALSRWYETAPVGGTPGQPPFLNAAAMMQTTLSPDLLLTLLQSIENAFGRQRSEHWGPRTLDLDLLLYDNLVVETPRLTVPHPRMIYRRFVLEPAAEIAAELPHPLIGWTIGQLWRHWQHAVNYIAIAGPPGVGKRQLASSAMEAYGPGAIHLLLDPIACTQPSPDSAGLAWQNEIQFLTRRVTQLDRGNWLQLAPLVVSDYWIGQSLAYASVNLPLNRFTEFETVCWQASSKTMPPKYLIVLDDSGEAAAVDLVTASIRETVATCLRREIHAPRIQLDASQPELVQREFLAIVDSLLA